MYTWSQFHTYVTSEVPSAPLPMVDFMLRKAAIEFCEETAIHVIDGPAMDVVASTASYSIDPIDTELDICAVKYAWFNGAPLPYISQETLNDGSYSYWPADTAPTPSAFTQQDQDNIILYPIPTSSYTAALRTKLVVKPSLTSTGVYDWIGKRYIQEISAGALAMMTGMVGKAWSNTEAEKRYRAQFEAAKTKGTVDSNRSFTRASLQLARSRTW